MPGNIEGKVALVAGASSGIGAATALMLAGAGVRVGLAARRRERIEELSSAIAASGGESIPIEADLADERQAQGAVEQTVRRFGRIDILAQVAGFGVAAPFSDTTADEYRRMVDINLLGALYTLRPAIDAMKSQGSGHVVIVSSGVGRYIHPSTVYSGTKHAISAIAESLRREVGKDHIRVTSIEPGAVRTEFTQRMRDEVRASVERRLGDMEQLEAEDVAAAIMYAVTQPSRVNVNILTIYPTEQA